MEDNIYAFDAYLVWPRREHCTRTELEVSQQSVKAILLYNKFDRYQKVATRARNNLKIPQECVGNEAAGSKGLQGSPSGKWLFPLFQMLNFHW